VTAVSHRAAAANGAFDAVKNFILNSRYGERRADPGIADFTFGKVTAPVGPGGCSPMLLHSIELRQKAGSTDTLY
jgi:hypothetical protein